MTEWNYDAGKKAWFRSFSECCRATMTQKMLYRGKGVTGKDFKLTETVSKEVVAMVPRKWWQIWEPKFKRVTTTTKETAYKKVVFRFFCDDCKKPCRAISKMRKTKPKGVCSGNKLVSKTSKVGSTPATPAKEENDG